MSAFGCVSASGKSSHRAARRVDGAMFRAFAGGTSLRPGIKVLVDLGYDADLISAFCQSGRVWANIPPTGN